MVTACSFTRTTPRRVVCSALAAMTSVTSDSPSPAPGETCSQAASVAAVHEHSRAAVTTTLVRPPAAGNVDGVPASAVLQRASGVGPDNSVTLVPLQATANNSGRTSEAPARTRNHVEPILDCASPVPVPLARASRGRRRLARGKVRLMIEVSGRSRRLGRTADC
jgi:hypothetical protein